MSPPFSFQLLVVEASSVFRKLELRKFERILPRNQLTAAGSFHEVKEILADRGDDYFHLAVIDPVLEDCEADEVIDYLFEHGVPSLLLSAAYTQPEEEESCSKKVIDYVIKESEYSLDYVVKFIRVYSRNAETRVLVVDDSPFARKHAAQLLRKHGFVTLEAESGAHALSVIRTHPNIKLVITDYNMPEMDGCRLTQEVRRCCGPERMAVIGVSNSDNPGLSVQFIKHGANDFLHKPYLDQQFYCRVYQNLELVHQFQDLLEANERIARANLMKTEFLEQTHHDLRNPLNAVLGYAYLLENEGYLSQDHLTHVEKIKSAAKKMMSMADEFLDLARIESGRVEASPEQVDLPLVLGQAVDLQCPGIRGKNLEVETEIDDQLEMESDPRLLHRIMDNLLSNAVKYNKEGGKIKVSAHSAADGKRLQIEVSDTGMGLSETQVQQLFVPFQRFAKKEKGTGLGLVITKKLVSLLEGDIHVESTEGQGTSFRMTFPRKLRSPDTLARACESVP